MMNVWKEAFWLARFEMRASLKMLFLLLGFSFIYGVFFSISTFEQHSFLFDFFFLIIFWFMPIWTKPKEFQLQKISEGLWASPFVVMLNQLPVQKNVLIISRFITYFTFSIPTHIFILGFIYFFAAEFRESISITAYIVFSIIWICFGITFGSMFPTSDVGDKVPKSSWLFAAISVLFFGAVIGTIVAINKFTGRGIVSWSISIAREWPILSVILSCLIAFISIVYSIRIMSKKMDQIDYLK